MWPFSFLLFFACGRLAYSAATPHAFKKGWFMGGEVLLSAVFVLAGRYWVFGSHYSPIAKALILGGGLFGLPAIALRLAVPWRVDRSGHNSELRRVSSLGIIDFSWLLMLSLGIAMVWVMATTTPVCDPLPAAGLAPDYYKEYRAQASEIFAQCVLALIAVATGLSVCMTILLAGGKWRRSITSGAGSGYGVDVRSAMKMVWACFLFVLGFLIWVMVPLYERMTGVLERLKQA